MPHAQVSTAPGFVIRFLTSLALCAALSLGAGQAMALSELKTLGSEPVTPGEAGGQPGVELDGTSVLPRREAAPEKPQGTVQPESVRYSHDISALPEPVRKLREAIVEAAASGDLERLRPLLGTGDRRTQVPGADEETDAIEALKGISGDAEGLEILAIILDLVSGGYAHVNAGGPDEIYIWPYFALKDMETLTPPEKVELLRIVTAGDLMGMQDYGSYNFFQIGLTPDGRWKFLTAGE